MHQQKGKKTLIYFFFLFFFTSIHNINLSSLELKKIQDIKVIGLTYEDNSILQRNIENLKLDNIYFINKKNINYIINSNSLIEKYEIFKKYPSSLVINVDKTKFLAKINHKGKIFLVGSNGKLSKNNFSNNKLPFIFGKPDIEDFLNFKKIIDHSKFSYDEIKNFYFFPSSRWDFELKNNLIIKLPQNYAKESLDLVYDFRYIKNFKDIKIIDARIKDQVIIND